MGKVLQFQRPTHDCYPRQIMRSAGVVEVPCPICKDQLARKRQHVAASRERGDTTRREKGWK